MKLSLSQFLASIAAGLKLGLKRGLKKIAPKSKQNRQQCCGLQCQSLLYVIEIIFRAYNNNKIKSQIGFKSES